MDVRFEQGGSDPILGAARSGTAVRLEDVLDVPALQSMMEDFYQVARIPMSVIDVEGRILVGVGWQDICTRFHRVHPETARHCQISDTVLSEGVPQGRFRRYRCQNNLWDLVTPIVVEGQHLGNLFSGQFFLDTEIVDREAFRAQARRYGFDEEEYLAALDRVPRLGREHVEAGMAFLLKLAHMLSMLGRSNLAMRQMNETLEQRVAERTTEVEAQAARLRQLASQLAQAEQRERTRVAKLLHDQVQQLLVAAKMQAGSAFRRAQDLEIRDAILAIEDRLDESIEASRLLTTELSPLVLHDRGLVPALDWLARWMADRHGLEVRVATTPEAEPIEEAIRLTLFEAVRELLLNVVKHAGTRVATVQASRAPSGGVRIVVTDDGVGFDVGPQETGTSGTGFGLFGLRQRFEHLGGSVEVRSRPGHGTIVTVTAPIEHPLGTDLPVAAAAAVASQALLRDAAGRIRVLLVDDHKILRQGLATMIGLEGDMDVVGEASDGREALELVERLHPRVVVMDVSMPVMDGVEATRRITTDHPDVRVIGLSLHEPGDLSRAMTEAGAVAYLNKAGPADALVRTIRDAAVAAA